MNTIHTNYSCAILRSLVCLLLEFLVREGKCAALPEGAALPEELVRFPIERREEFVEGFRAIVNNEAVHRAATAARQDDQGNDNAIATTIFSSTTFVIAGAALAAWAVSAWSRPKK